MNSPLSYTGRVTATVKRSGKTLSRTYFNNGTNLLFEAYARALAGQPISQFIPAYIDVGCTRTDSNGLVVYESHMRNPASVIPIFVSKTYSTVEGYNYGVPFTRVEAMLTKSHFTQDIDNENTNTIKLKSVNDGILATVSVAGLYDLINNMPIGAQLVIVWDLFVDNKEVIEDTTEPEQDGGSE